MKTIKICELQKIRQSESAKKERGWVYKCATPIGIKIGKTFN